MRKMKKINGFLVVRFNDREKRNDPTLGSFGVIDAEQYTGDLDFDLDAFEYTDADRIEIAVEQARGLNAEEDFSDEPATYTVITETADEAREEEVAPKAMALSWAEQLKTQIKSKHYPDIDPRTAAHELNGYKTALRDLGLLDRDDAVVEPDAFGDVVDEETLAYVCDELCRFREGRTQEELDAICEKCKLESWARGKARTGTPPERETFANIPAAASGHRQAKKVYALGLTLAEECPDNDCKLYLNIFNMARELDAALDKMGGYPAEVMRRELNKHFRELGRMYYENRAVQMFKEGMQP